MANVTDAYTYLKNELLKLSPGSQWGGDFANKPGYHNCRSNLPSYDYSVTDKPPDGGGSSTVAGAIDWTFPDAQAGNYATIAKFTKRLMTSAKDPNDPRLNGFREFYGNLNDGGPVDGYDTRYGYPVTSDSSHYWHIHISEDRDKTASYENKDNLLSVLRGESVDEWGGDMPSAEEVAKAVWNYNIASSGTYSGKGALWTVYNRTGYLANTFAPATDANLKTINNKLDQIHELLNDLVETYATEEQITCALNDLRATLEQLGTAQ
jgi:hypothetical protein